jgi:hypothetical protein
MRAGHAVGHIVLSFFSLLGDRVGWVPRCALLGRMFW